MGDAALRLVLVSDGYGEGASRGNIKERKKKEGEYYISFFFLKKDFMCYLHG